VTLATGNAPYAYGVRSRRWRRTTRPTSATAPLIYQLIDDTKYARRSNLTDYGRQLWSDDHVGDEAAGLYDNDDIVIFNEDPDLLNRSCRRTRPGWRR